MNDRAPDSFEFDGDAEAMLGAFRADEALPDDVSVRVWERIDADIATTSASSRPPQIRRVAIASLVAAAAVALVWAANNAVVARRHNRTPVAAVREGDATASDGVAHQRGYNYPRPVEPPTESGTAVPDPKAASPSADSPAAAYLSPTSPASPPPASPPPTTVSATERQAPRSNTAAGAAKTNAPRPPRRSDESVAPSGSAPDAAAPKRAAPSRLGDEIALIQGARRALRQRDSAAALRALAEHACEFKTGGMTRERKALQAIATCRLEGVEHGHARAEAFLRAHGTSVLADRVRDECEVQ